MSIELVSLQTIQEITHEYGYWTVFIGILLENTGIPIPGETITLVGGFLAGNDELNYWLVLGSAIVGATLGDNFGYWIGRYGGWKLLTRVGKLFRIQETQLLELRNQFSENAAKAVFLGRFIALLRIFAGPLAGSAHMPYLKFIACNFAGAALWATIMVSLSFFAGKLVSLEQLITWVSRFTFVALGLVAAWFAFTLWWENRAKFAKPVKQPD
jgi:membrane protein DedA with SNARE-associated domain